MKMTLLLIGSIFCLSLFGQDDAWKTVRTDLPFSETFAAGAKIVFVISYDDYSKVDFTNASDNPAKVIFHVSENGNPLPDEKIGPVKYRTIALDPGEKRQLTFNWEKGHEVALEVHDGKVSLDVRPE